jgi:hypothetical protein
MEHEDGVTTALVSTNDHDVHPVTRHNTRFEWSAWHTPRRVLCRVGTHTVCIT